MRFLRQIIKILALCSLSLVTGKAQEFAVFKLPDAPRAFLFNFWQPSDVLATSYSSKVARGVEGVWTVQAKRFKTTQDSRGATITFFDAIVCRAQRIEGEGPHSSVMIVGEMSIPCPTGASVLVFGRFMRLADLSEKTFDPPISSKTYTGDDAIKKLKEIGLEPPADMDPAWKDRGRK